MISFPFQPQFTWRKLGYLYHTNSLEYRAVLEENPQWDVVTLPPIGAQLRVSNSTGNIGNLRQASFITATPTSTATDAIFPFNTEAEYLQALNLYTLQGVILRDSINGYNMDSDPAFTGIQ